MPKVPKEEQERNKKILTLLLKNAENKECCDCNAKGPTWSAFNWGIFVCIKCAGIHRKMGTHISKVKSCNLDSWFDREVEMVKAVGNRRANQHYEAGFNGKKPDEHDDISMIEEFIRNKYERRLWMAKGAERGALAFVQGTVDVSETPTAPEDDEEEQKPVKPVKPAKTETPRQTRPISRPENHASMIEFEEPQKPTPVQKPIQHPGHTSAPATPEHAPVDSKNAILSMFDKPKQPVVPSNPYMNAGRGMPPHIGTPVYYPQNPVAYPPGRGTYPPAYPPAYPPTYPPTYPPAYPAPGYPPAYPPVYPGYPPQPGMPGRGQPAPMMYHPPGNPRPL